MHILITGANGFIGQHLVSTLMEQGHQITACVRDINTYKSKLTSIETIECNYNKDIHIKDWIPRLKNIDVVVNAVGIIKETKMQQFGLVHQDTPIALFKACEKVGIKKVIQISALGADDSAFSQYHLSKKSADDFLKTLDLDWIILMPSIVYGPNAKSMSLFTTMAALPITPVIDAGEQKIQPIHINDVCSAISKIINGNPITKKSIALVGPTPITMKELTLKLKKWLGLTTNRFIHIPIKIAISLTRFTQIIPDNIISTESIKMLLKGNTGDATLFTNVFGFIPISLEQTLRQNPARQADRWHAKLTLLRPLLKFSIAFIWIYTGIISLFVYPIESSFHLLSQVGITHPLNLIALYTMGIVDLIIGFTVLLNYHVKLIGSIQVILILGYTTLISIFLAEQWIHPFGPISKNIPLIISILIIISLEDK